MIRSSKLFTIVMISSIALAVTACDDGSDNSTPTDICEGITCSDHGTCFVNANGEAACTCAQGYHNANNNVLACEPDDPDNPCKGQDCNGHGTCSADADGSAACTCEHGYHNTSNNVLACEPDDPADPCKGQDCNGHGTCTVDANGTATCTCSQGYHNATDNVLARDPDDPLANPCDGIDCSGHGSCALDNEGKALCNCEGGYTNETPTTCVQAEIDSNHNYMIDTYETASDQGVDCAENHNAGCSDFCDSFIDYKCSTKCTSDSQCISNDYFCRSDGRCAPKVFETVWEVKKDGAVVKFPGGNSYDGTGCNYTIDWGDGSQNTYDSCDCSYREHQYQKAGTYNIKLTGQITKWKCEYNDLNDYSTTYLCGTLDGNGEYSDDIDDYLIEVKSFGPVGLDESAFVRAADLKSVSTVDIPNSQLLTTMDSMFENCNHFNSPIENWDTSNVDSMIHTFYMDSSRAEHYPPSFNQPIEKWDTSKVILMEEMFYGATAFNQPLGKWNVSSVVKMQYMFYGAELFNQTLENWNVSNVKDMSYMFAEAKSFNQPIDNWNVAKVEYMNSMFRAAKAFNQPLNNWKTTALANIIEMFYGASAFDQPLDKWDVSQLNYGYYRDAFKDSGLSETNWNLMKENNPGWANMGEYELGFR